MSDSDETVIICVRVVDVPLPRSMSALKTCARCGERVWLADSTPRIPGAALWCWPCYEGHGEPGDVLLPLSEAQLDDIERALDPDSRY